jgi:hypothetical protein
VHGAAADLFADLETRGKALREHDKQFITRELAEKDDRLHPRVVVIDECQHLFLSKYGPTAIKMALQLITTSRKYGITLIFATPEPTNDSCPRQIMSVISNKACFPIGDQTGNDAVLGTGSHKAGYTAVGLEPKTVTDVERRRRHVHGAGVHGGAAADARVLRSATMQGHRRAQACVGAARGAGRAGCAGGRGVAGRSPGGHPAGHRGGAADAHGGGHVGAGGVEPAGVPAVVARRPEGVPGAVGAAPYKTKGTMQVSAEKVREGIERRDAGKGPEVE